MKHTFKHILADTGYSVYGRCWDSQRLLVL